MKIKLTPLNIVSAVCIVLAVLILFSKQQVGVQKGMEVSWLFSVFCFLSAVIAFVSDLIFRKFIPDLKKIWIIEGVLVIFIVILIFL